MRVAVLVQGDHLLVALMAQVERVAVVLQVQQTPLTLEQSTLVVAVLVILMEQIIQPLGTSAAVEVLVLSLFATQTRMPPQHQPQVLPPSRWLAATGYINGLHQVQSLFKEKI